MDLHVRRMKSRYRLPPSGSAVASRLDVIAGGLLGEVLSVAVARDAQLSSSGRGADGGEEICVRHARVVLRVRASESDADLAAKWGATAADTLRAAVTDGDPSNVVRYASRAQALVDFANGAARGDLERQWAWRQLGFWRAQPVATGPRAALDPGARGASLSPSLTTARSELLRALISYPRSIVPTLAALARGGALRPLVTTWTPAELRRLVETALLAADAPVDVHAGPAAPSAGADTPPATGPGPLAEGASPVTDERSSRTSSGAGDTPRADVADRAEGRAGQPGAARVLAASPLGAFAMSARDLPAASLESLVVLAALDAEPTTLRAGKPAAGRLVRAMLEDLRRRHGAAPAANAHTSHSQPRPSPEAPRSASPARVPPRVDGPAPPAQLTRVETRATGESTPPAPPALQRAPRENPRAAAPPGRTASPSADLTRPVEDARTPARASETPATARPSTPPVAATDSSPNLPLDEGTWDLDRRPHGTTRAGGLLFLLHIVGELGLADALADDVVLGARPVRWALHQLALLLGDVADGDPAALAFAGLGPDAEPPSAHEEPASAAEQEALSGLVARVVTRLRERLAPTTVPARLFAPSSSPRDAEGAATGDIESPGARAAARELLSGVTRRHAEIFADPGWFEVRLSLDEVRTDVRRAGLDLDPDYLPWLGVVVRFTYA